jgi:hypothetical protein
MGVLVFYLVVAFVFCRAPIPPYGSSINFSGNNRFVFGVNYPWLHYGTDFGFNAWGVTGVASQLATHQTNFADMTSKKVQVNRWWLFADSRAGIVYDSNRVPIGLDAKVLMDMDAAVGLARANGQLLILVLFDFHFLDWYSVVNGVTIAGRTDVITDSNKLNGLLNNVINPILQRYANEPSILAWEIMNEPEWVISDIPQPSVDTSKENPVTIAQFYNFASAISQAVHNYTNAYVTLGSACLKWYRIWTPSYATSKDFTPLYLDFYQTHYYSWMDNQSVNTDPDLGTYHNLSPLEQTYSTLSDVDRPMIVGEFGNSAKTTGSMIDTIVTNGYAGSLAWSYDASDGYTIDWTSFLASANNYSSIIGPQPSASPTSLAPSTTSSPPTTTTSTIGPSTTTTNPPSGSLLVSIVSQYWNSWWIQVQITGSGSISAVSARYTDASGNVQNVALSAPYSGTPQWMASAPTQIPAGAAVSILVTVNGSLQSYIVYNPGSTTTTPTSTTTTAAGSTTPTSSSTKAGNATTLAPNNTSRVIESTWLPLLLCLFILWQ